MTKRDVIGQYRLPIDVKLCRKCTMSNQRPRISFDEQGVCSACNYADYKQTRQGRLGRIGTGTGIAIGRLVQTILKMMGSKAEVVVEQSRMRPEQSEVMELVCDASQAKTVTGWAPSVSLESGLRETIDWIRKNQQRYKAGIYNF